MAKFLVNGKEFDANAPTPRQVELKKFFDSLTDEVVTLRELQKRTGPINPDTVTAFCTRFKGYSYKMGNKLYYGSPAAINKFKQKLEQSRRQS